jgi:hypothetical protein
MAKKDYIPRPDAEFLLHHNQLTAAAAAPGSIVPPADQAALATDNLKLNQDFQASTAADISAKAATAKKIATRAEVEKNERRMVQQWKRATTYTTAAGKLLGVEGPEEAHADLTAIQPVFTVKLAGDHVLVEWNWGSFSTSLDMCEIQVDRNDGKGRRLLTMDTTPGYNDTAPWPATPTKWTYWAIYWVGDARVGQWSAPVSLLVGG